MLCADISAKEIANEILLHIRGGWTEVEAPTVNLACAAFRAVHPDKEPGILNCSSAYTEESFLGSCMAGPDGNFRKFCHERISFTVEPSDPDEPVDFGGAQT